MINCGCKLFYHDHGSNPCERKIDPSQGYICQECLDQSKNSDE